MRDDRIAGPPEAFKMARVQRVELFHSVKPRGDEMQVIIDRTAPDPAGLRLVKSRQAGIEREVEHPGLLGHIGGDQPGGIRGAKPWLDSTPSERVECLGQAVIENGMRIGFQKTERFLMKRFRRDQ